MAQALSLAARGLNACEPNPRVGCVLVRDGGIVGRGFHARAGGPHAEVVALREAGAAARGATAYVSLEPCCHHGRTPPCTDALLDAGVTRVVAAIADPFPQVDGGGLRRLRAAGVDVRCGLLEPQAREVNRGFLSRVQRGRPFVTSKVATSLDGATAMASGESRWITGAAARADVHARRARAGAVLTGVATVLADDPALTVRDADPPGDWRQPLRVVLDSGLRTPPTARLLRDGGATLLIHADSADPSRANALREQGAETVAVVADAAGRLDLAAALGMLGARGVNEVMVEAGGTLNGALLGAGLVDEIVWYQAPLIMGASVLAAWRMPGAEAMRDRVALDVLSVRRVGADLRIVARPGAAPGADGTA